MRPLALDSLRSVPTTTLAVLAAIFLAAACAGEDLSTDDAPQPISTGGSSVGGQAGASLAGQGGSAGPSGGSGQGGSPGKGGASGAGMSGSSGQAGEPGAGAAGEGAGGSGAGGAAGDAGAAGDTAMAGASSEMGGAAGTDAGAAGATSCDPAVLYYLDQDGDGYGNPAKSQMGCLGTGTWVANADDCNDDNPDVFIGQTKFFDKGYPRAGAPSGVSFDYDCSGKEEHDPLASAGVDGCGGFDKNCSDKSGVLATERKGAGIDSLCGSESMITCSGTNVTGCSGKKSTIGPVRCH